MDDQAHPSEFLPHPLTDHVDFPPDQVTDGEGRLEQLWQPDEEEHLDGDGTAIAEQLWESLLPSQVHRPADGGVEQVQRGAFMGGGVAGAFGAMWPMILGIAALFIVTSWQSRSQKKKLAGEIAALKKGDRVRLQSGFIAKLVELRAQISVVELGSNLRVEVLTSAIVGRDDSDTTAPAAKK